MIFFSFLWLVSFANLECAIKAPTFFCNVVFSLLTDDAILMFSFFINSRSTFKVNVDLCVVIQVWINAAAQIFNSLGLSIGTVVVFSSFNKFDHSPLRWVWPHPINWKLLIWIGLACSEQCCCFFYISTSLLMDDQKCRKLRVYILTVWRQS